MGMNESNFYDKQFYCDQAPESLKSAAAVVPILCERFAPKRVIDVGCGVGTWLNQFVAVGVEEVQGVDGEYVDKEQLCIDHRQFRALDVSQPLPPLGRFDLAITLEVAEHLPPERSESFVEDLTTLADVVVFSAAIPGQGGKNHINERWQDEWALMFAKRGYRCDDFLRPLIWNNPNVACWYKQNIVVYIKQSADDSHLASMPQRLVHHDVYEGLLLRTDENTFKLRQAFRIMLKAVKRTFKRVSKRITGAGRSKS